MELPVEGIIFTPKDVKWLLIPDTYKERVTETINREEGKIKPEQLLEILDKYEIPYIQVKDNGRELEIID